MKLLKLGLGGKENAGGFNWEREVEYVGSPDSIGRGNARFSRPLKPQGLIAVLLVSISAPRKEIRSEDRRKKIRSEVGIHAGKPIPIRTGIWP